MKNPYKTREGGATVTVFVPYDCNNNCPFCVNKEEYADMSRFSIEKICESIRKMDSITPYCDFVFTGGEPFAQPDKLQIMLDCVPKTHKIYINTTLPVSEKVTEEDILDFVEKNKDKITCINVSRHLRHFVVESNDHLLEKLPVKFRVNCVLYTNYPKDRLVPYLDRFLKVKGANIQFRFDYTETTLDNLYDVENDPIFHDLCEIASYKGVLGCRMRNGYYFDYKGMEMTYHKTLPYSTLQIMGEDGITYDVLYDTLIKQTGEIHSDWDGTVMDVPAYEKVVYEPYDLKWIEKFF